MKNLIDFIDFENFCKNNLNELLKYEDQKYFIYLNKIPIYELKK